MNLMQLMKSAMHSVVRCLVSSIILISQTAFAYEPEYIEGVGETAGLAVRNLRSEILKVSAVNVASHTTLENINGKYGYKSTIVTDSGVSLPMGDVELIHKGNMWVARIDKSKVFQQDVKWIEQNITVNNTYNETPVYSYGFRRDVSTTRTTKRTNIIGPSGRIVKSEPGSERLRTTRRNWNGRYGYTWETDRKIR